MLVTGGSDLEDLLLQCSRPTTTYPIQGSAKKGSGRHKRQNMPTEKTDGREVKEDVAATAEATADMITKAVTTGTSQRRTQGTGKLFSCPRKTEASRRLGCGT